MTSTEDAKTRARAQMFVEWLRVQTELNKGKLPVFSKGIAAEVMGFDTTELSSSARTRGQVYSLIDFACYACNLPPIGLASEDTYARGWRADNGWVVPQGHMGQAAKGRVWRDGDFLALQEKLAALPPGASALWTKENTTSLDKVKLWAYSFVLPDEPVAVKVNPKWTRDELMLALHLYLHNRESPPGKNSTAVTELSRLLNQMNPTRGATNYRNTAGVYMKLMNFRGIDPIYTAEGKRGLSQGSKDDQVVWDLFAHRLSHLDSVVASLKTIIGGGRTDSAIDEPDEPEIEDCEEGRIFTRLHRYRERNRKLVADFKALSLKKHGQLRCGGCDTDFAMKYGAMADRLVDVHHTKPIHTMKPGDKTDPKDLVLLCVSCHGAVHSEKQWLSVDELRRRLGKPQVI